MAEQKQIGITDAAKQLGEDPQNVRRAAKRLKLLKKIVGRYTLSPSDLPKVKKEIHDGPGNPNFTHR